MKDKLIYIFLQLRKSYFTTTAGIICITAGVVNGVLHQTWETASIAITAGLGLLAAKDVKTL